MTWPATPKQNTTQEQSSESNEEEQVLSEVSSKTEKRYKREVWWLNNRHKVKKYSLSAIATLEIILLLIGIWSYVDYYIINYVEEQNLAQSFFAGAGDLHLGAESQMPIDLELSKTTVIATGKKSDLITTVKNNNKDWVAEITYRYKYNEGGTDQKQVVIMQDTEMPIVEFAVEGRRPTNAKLEIDNIEWFHIDLHEIKDPVAWKNERMNFSITNAQHGDVVIGETRIGRTSFKIKNKGGYGFYDINLYIILRRGGIISGVNRVILSSLEPLEEQDLQVNWFGSIPTATKVEVIPVINLFEKSSYQDETTTPELDRRDILKRR